MNHGFCPAQSPDPDRCLAVLGSGDGLQCQFRCGREALRFAHLLPGTPLHLPAGRLHRLRGGCLDRLPPAGSQMALAAGLRPRPVGDGARAWVGRKAQRGTALVPFWTLDAATVGSGEAVVDRGVGWLGDFTQGSDRAFRRWFSAWCGAGRKRCAARGAGAGSGYGGTAGGRVGQHPGGFGCAADTRSAGPGRGGASGCDLRVEPAGVYPGARCRVPLRHTRPVGPWLSGDTGIDRARLGRADGDRHRSGQRETAFPARSAQRFYLCVDRRGDGIDRRAGGYRLFRVAGLARLADRAVCAGPVGSSDRVRCDPDGWPSGGHEYGRGYALDAH